MTALANSAGIENGIRTRALPANSTSIAGSGTCRMIYGFSCRVLRRRNQYLRKPICDRAQLLPPTIDLAGTDRGATCDLTDHRTGC
jgi:hypothetical protein